MSQLIRSQLLLRLRAAVCAAPGRPPSLAAASRRHLHDVHHPPIKLRHTYLIGACLFTTQMGRLKVVRNFATILPPPPPTSGAGGVTPAPKPVEPPEDQLTIVLGEIRSQEKIFNIKSRQHVLEEMENRRKMNQAHLEGSIKTEMLRSTSAAPFVPTAVPQEPLVDEKQVIFETSREPMTMGGMTLDVARKVQQATRPLGSTREIVYPKQAERPQVPFKTPVVEPPVSEPIPTPQGPRFLESTTHRVKTQLSSTKSTEGSTGSVDMKSRVISLSPRSPQPTSSTPSTPPTPPTPSVGRPVQASSPQTTTPVKLTSILTDQPLRILPLFAKSKKSQASVDTKTGAQPGTSGDSSSSGQSPGKSAETPNEEEDEEKQRTSAQQKRWMRLKYTMGFLGFLSCVFSGYLIVFIGAPKYDSRGKLIIDQYSDLPVMMQYYSRIRDEFETYNRMIKEPSRDKLLPDVLEPPYYQPPYTLVLEFTDLLVHPEWTYQCGWRFKKRPGVDQFLEALYTRFEVVVYTAQMGLTVFPIMEALDGRNLISYKLVRDATNFIDGDHVKDLDKINRDLSKVVVVDWNPQSVKLHKNNLFQIPRWEGNDDDNTLFDLAAFLIAISEWEVQDVRSVLQYYAQFDNPLAKFKENQMQALQATQS